MKRVLILLLGLVAFLVAGCTADSTAPESQEVETQISEVTLDRTDTYPDSKVEITYPQGLGNEKVDADAKSWVQDHYTKAMTEFFNDAKYEYLITYTVQHPSSKYVSVIFQTYLYTGGAHGMTTTDVLNYDLTTGKRLELGDLFPTETLPKIQQKLGEAAKEAGYDNSKNEMFADPAKLPIQTLQKIAFTKEGLEFYYDPYIVAPYAVGTVVLKIDKQNLEENGVDSKFWE